LATGIDDEQRQKWRESKLLARAKERLKEGLTPTPKQYDALVESGIVDLSKIFPIDPLFHLTNLEEDFEEKAPEPTTGMSVVTQNTEVEEKYEAKVPKILSKTERLQIEIDRLVEKAKKGPKYFSEIDEIRLSHLREQLGELRYRAGRAVHLWRKK